MPKKPRARAGRRAAERATSKLENARERLFQLEAGGSPERPIVIATAAIVEAHATAVPCPRCSAHHDLVEHVAVTIGGARLREARLRCHQCGTRRSLWFRIHEAKPN